MLLFAFPYLEPIARPTLVSAVLVVLYLMTPLDIIVTWVPIVGRAQASLLKVQSLIPALEQPHEVVEASSSCIEDAWRSTTPSAWRP